MKPGKSRLKPLSAKGAKVKRRYKQVCDNIDDKMFDAHDRIYCTSCNKTVAGMDVNVRSWGHSHNLRKGRFPELETEEENISPRCQGFNCCHEHLDAENFQAIQYFKDLDQIMAYRLKVYPGEYNNFVTGLREVGCWNYAYVEFDK